jgi:hypothetical protein
MMSEPTWTAAELADWLEDYVAPGLLMAAAFSMNWPAAKVGAERDAAKARAAAALLRKQGPAR